jgi:hypothetical protein
MVPTDHHESESEIIQANQAMDRRKNRQQESRNIFRRAGSSIRSTAGRLASSNPFGKSGSEKSLAEVAEKAKRAPRNG